MKKIVHVHADHKFINESLKYEGNLFNNVLILLDSKNQHNKEFHDTAFFFEPNEHSLKEIVKIIDEAELLVLYNLGFFRSRIANAVGSDIKIIWRFFGHELYDRQLYQVLGPKTRPYFIKNFILWKFKLHFSFFFSEERSFYKALKRIDAMICVYKDEYEHLIRRWPDLPQLIPTTIDHNFHKVKKVNNFSKKNILVIGNSRSHYNNHIELLDVLKKSIIDENLKIKLPFNYGDENKYTDEVKKRATSLENVEIIESFIPLTEFESFYDNVDAMVNNSYRQFALGNIFLALHKGVKVYLNRRSPTYSWLKNAGVLVYSIENLKKDLQNEGCLRLSEKEMTDNFESLAKLKSSRTLEDFQIEILELIEKRPTCT